MQSEKVHPLTKWSNPTGQTGCAFAF